jgi:hypothetical protein
MTEVDLKPAVLMKLKDFANLIRLVSFWTMRERTATILHFKKGKRHIMGTYTILPGYYDLEGLPLFIYIEQEEGPKGPFVKYRADPSEEWSYTEGTFDRQFPIYIPLITLDKVPAFLSNV